MENIDSMIFLAEEPGLIGSTEWVEDNKEKFSKNAIAYINVDTGTIRVRVDRTKSR